MRTDITKTDTTDMENNVDEWKVGSQTIDDATGQKQTEYMNDRWGIQLGYWNTIPELNRAITSLAIWTAGKGYTTDNRTEAILENITGWGEDTFTSILINMIKVKKFGRDSYAEIIRNEETGTFINLMPLNTGRMKHIINPNGTIKRYEYQYAKGKYIKFQPKDILHLCNDRIANQIHGTSMVDITQWVTDARHEAMTDWKRISHRSTIRVLYVEEDNKTRYKELKRDYAAAIDKGEVLILPGKPADAGFQDLNLPPAESFLAWIRYLENYYYQAVGVPRVIATSENYTESGAKVGFMTFEPVYTNEQVQLEGDIWNQLAIKIKFNRPPSLGGEMKEDEAKDGAVGFQPNDTKLTAEGRE